MRHPDSDPKSLADPFARRLDPQSGSEGVGHTTPVSIVRDAASCDDGKQIEAAAVETGAMPGRADDVIATIGVESRSTGRGCDGGAVGGCVASGSLEADPTSREATASATPYVLRPSEIVLYVEAHAWARTLKRKHDREVLEQRDEEAASNGHLAPPARTSFSSVGRDARSENRAEPRGSASPRERTAPTDRIIAATRSTTRRSHSMAPDTKPGRGEKSKAPERKVAPALKPEPPKKAGTSGGPTKPGVTKKR